MNRHIQHLELEPRAGDFLELLRDLGHLDDAAVERLTAALVASARPGRTVHLDELRRIIAIQLFDAESSMRPEAREVLSQEWPRLFS